MIKHFETLSDVEILSFLKDNHRLQLNTDLPEFYKCWKCKGLLIDPIQTVCGCRYCRICFVEYVKDEDRPCLNDIECGNSNVGHHIINDRAVSRDILKMVIKCPFTACNKQFEVRDVKVHILTCEHMEEKCDLCGACYLKREEEKHMKDFCSKRMVSCQHCNIKIKYCLLEDVHFNPKSPQLCREYKGNCEYGCGQVTLYDHKEKCMNRPVTCPFEGCQKKCTKNTINEHFFNETYDHLLKFMEETKRKDKQIEDLEEEMKSKIEDIMRLKERCVSVLKNEKESFRILNLPNSQSINRKKDIFRKGTLIWRIDNFEKMRSDAENRRILSVVSDPFYSSEFGYKLCMKIYPDGDGGGYKTHLSVYFVVMKGEYDGLQTWPFRNKVTLSIESVSNMTHSETFRPDPTSACYAKPISEYNIASGSPRFIKFDELSKYIIDGTLFIKMFVCST